MKILLIEDERKIASIIARGLQEEAYAVDHATNGQDALNLFAINEYDLIILDLLLPGIQGGGFAVCEQVRQMNKNIPILMLTALDSHNDKVKGLDLGADDYLVKPFHLGELLARVRALLRRTPQATRVKITIRDITLDTATKSVTRGERDISLSAKEYAVLEYLMRNAGIIVNQTEIIEHAWDSNYDGLSNVVETYIRYLRKKLSPNGESSVIMTRRGHGYVIERDS
jgi:DNA-binding response OmpR family regulator